MATAVKASPPQQRSFRSCSICSFKSYILSPSDGGGTENEVGYGKEQNHTSSSSTAGLLDASFVNIYSPIIDTTNTNSSSRSSSDIDSILNDALSHTTDHSRAAAPPLRGGTFQEASMKMDAYAEAAMELIVDGQNNVEEGKEKKYFCNVCIERIGHAIDSYSEHILDESMVYDEAASSEEERSSSIRKMLSRVVNLNNNAADAAAADKDDNNMIVSNDGEEDSAIQWAIDSFQLELEALANACHDQEEELRILQTLMQNQIVRSKSISNEEDRVMDALNALEIDAHNFREESNLVTKQCSDVMSELDALSKVNLTSLSFKIAVNWSGSDNDGGSGTTTATQQKAGRYPTINNLRLAYRVNQKAGLGRKEICAAWNQAAQLITFTCGLNPSFNFSNVRLIPLSYPCAKIVATFPEGQSVHNLGWDTLDGEDVVSSHVPSLSITLFLALLSELSDHIISILANEQHDGATTLSSPPFPMTQCSIDSVDVTCLGDTDTASWSSVVFCIAVNLRWLAQLKLPVDMLHGK